MSACPSCGGSNSRGARFCQHCGRSLSPLAPARETRKTVTVLFSDLTGYTSLSEGLDPESVQAVLSRYFDAMRLVLERHGASVEKYIGDAIMAIFGVPAVHEDDALRAVRAADEMRSALEQLNRELLEGRGVELRARIGVNTGEVMVGDLVGGQAFVTGDAVNVAARLEALAPVGGVLIGETTHRLVEDAVRAEPTEPLQVKGREQPVQAYRLVEVLDEPSGHRRRFGSPLVGRRGELAAIREAFTGAATTEGCQLVTVLGGAGVGKSRLVLEFLAELGPKATALSGRCLPYGEGVAYWPAGEVVRAACGVEAEAEPDVVRAGIAERLRGEERAERIAEGVARMIGVAGAEGTPEETFWSFRRFLEVLARERPLVLVFDDVHWAKPAFLDLVEYLVDFLDGPVLVVCTARQELLDVRPEWGSTDNATTLSLGALSAEETGTLMENLLDGAPIEDAVCLRVTEASEGNPLFVEEMVRMLVEGGLLRRSEAGTWESAGDSSDLPVPPTISTLLAARLDRIRPEERATLQRASVAGKVFYWGAVAALTLPEDRERLASHLRSLVHKELITPRAPGFAGEDTYEFRHLLIRDAAYASIPMRERADLHELLASWIEGTAGARAAEYEEIVGHHLEQATRYRVELGIADATTTELAERAADRLASSARRALGRRDAPGAANLLSRAVALLPHGHPGRPGILASLAQALMEKGDLREAEVALEDALAAADALGDRLAEAHARLARLGLQLFTEPEGKTEAIAAEVQRVIPVFQQAGDESGMARAAHLLADVEWMRCRYASVEEHLERTIEHARRAGDRAIEVEALARLASTMLYGPTPAEAGIRRCAEIFERANGEPRVEASVLAVEAELRAMLGRFEGTREQIERARGILEELGLRFLSTAPSEALAFVEMLADDPAAAERALRWGYDLLEEMGERGFLSTAAAELAQAVLAQGRLEEAERFASISMETSASDDLASRVPAMSVLARVAAAGGDLDQGERLAREAVAMANQTDNFILRGDALLDLAGVLVAAGRGDEAGEAFDQAARAFEEKGNVVAARKVQSARAATEGPVP